MDVTQKILVKFLCLAKVKRTEMFCQPKLAKELIERESLSCRAREDPLKPFSLVLESAVGQTKVSHPSPTLITPFGNFCLG